MILSIDSDGFPPGFASRWENTQFASDADGQLHFIDIPMVRVGSHVTVTLLCYTADGTLVSSGYSSGTATENGVPLEIGILGSAQIVLGSNSAPNGSTTEHDGATYDVIEYTGTGLEMAAVNTTAGSTMQVKINGTVVSTTADQSFTVNLADGYNAIEVTVTKGSNEPVVVRRNIYVVRQFSTPVIALDSNGSLNGKTATGPDGKTYDVIEYTGTSLGMTVTNGFEGNATFEVKVNGNYVSGTPVTGSATAVNHTLADGFNAITATLTESVNGSVQAEKYVYVVKKLVKPVITMSGATPNGNTATSGGRNYTVIEYESALPTVTVTNGYTDTADFAVTKNGSPAASTAPATVTLSDGFNAIAATLSREHCVTQTEEKYYYAVKKLVKPVITMSGATANGKTATSGGKTYTVIEYESTLPTVTITNSYNGSASVSYEAKLGTTVLSTACPSTITNHALSDGFNAVTAALSEPYCDTLKEEKYYYVVKALTKPTVTYSDGILTNEAADAGGYHMLRYSYLAADPPVLPKFSVTNPYSDGSVTMLVVLDGTTLLTGDPDTGDISNRALTDGTHTIIITLSNDYCTEVSVTKKINVKMKAVEVQISGQIRCWYEDGRSSSNAPLLTQDFYIQAVNSSSAGEYAGETGDSKTCASVQSQWATYDNNNANISTDSTKNYVYLTAPDSTFKFWTSQSNDDAQGSWWMGFVPENDSTTTKTLAQLKASSANRSFDSGDRNNAGNPTSSGVRSRYKVTVTIADAAYTAGTDDEPPPSP